MIGVWRITEQKAKGRRKKDRGWEGCWGWCMLYGDREVLALARVIYFHRDISEAFPSCTNACFKMRMGITLELERPCTTREGLWYPESVLDISLQSSVCSMMKCHRMPNIVSWDIGQGLKQCVE
ncbi:hypothetical protein KQX54_018376 [Cotesia glomerata]|uniref:Uncharacterized protein n=1 Tax=Cotesia glomerata TaxID=32391 RepID=A0AAV7HF40_COTGL|nr:hypothetical protein KQX54_018376 [Cotesia glomerata]